VGGVASRDRKGRRRRRADVRWGPVKAYRADGAQLPWPPRGPAGRRPGKPAARPGTPAAEGAGARARTKLPFLATISYPGGSYEVEVLEGGIRFVRWLDRADPDARLAGRRQSNVGG
jgi:hypothetical protein